MIKKGILLFLLITVVLCGCSYNYYMNNSDEEPIIKVVDNNFNVTVDECIKILNDGIADENLDPIQEDYVVSEYEGCVMYKSLINDKLAIRFIKSDKENTDIGIIQLIVLDSYENQEYKKVVKATDDDYNTAAEYYKIICNSVEPRFETDRFLKMYDKDGGTYSNDVIVFDYRKYVSITEVMWNEEINLYQIFSSNDLFNQYENELWDDINQYFFLEEFVYIN